MKKFISFFFFFSSRRRHTRYWRDWSSDVCSSDLPGTGKEHPAKEDLVTVHYTGWKVDGTQFDSSVAKGKPAIFPVARVIAGFSEGLQLMVPGEKRRLWIPEALAYKGAR